MSYSLSFSPRIVVLSTKPKVSTLASSRWKIISPGDNRGFLWPWKNLYVEVLTARERSNWPRHGATFPPRCRSPAAIYLDDLKPSCTSHLFPAWKRNSSKGMQRRNICLSVLFRCLRANGGISSRTAREFIPPDQLEASYLTPRNFHRRASVTTEENYAAWQARHIFRRR